MELHPEWAGFEHRRGDPEVQNETLRNEIFLKSESGIRLLQNVLTEDSSFPARDDYEIPLRIYRKRQMEECSSVVLFYHSGGLTAGSLDTEDSSCRRLALDGSCTVVSVAYRLCPEFQYPTPMNDAWDAFIYVLKNMESLVPSPVSQIKLVISGTSSGGHLAAIVSQKAVDLFASGTLSSTTPNVDFCGVILRNPVTVCAIERSFIPPKFWEYHQSWAPEFETSLTREVLTKDYNALGVSDLQRTQPEVYPLWGEFHGQPRTFVQICDVDILRDDGVCYAKGLQDAGVDVRISSWEKLPHNFWVYAPSLQIAEDIQNDYVSGFKWILNDGMT